MKRLFDFFGAAFGLIVASPILLPVMFLVWWHDKHSPFYVANRVGRSGVQFRMVKLRSMVINADKTGVDSTGAGDNRITAVGHFIRRYKLDELSQLWNVLLGDMSFVGPRPNVKRETDLYSSVERGLLDAKPGITDFASIVFADEGDILKDEADPDLAYGQLIRPWKSRLGLFYVHHNSIWVDLRVIVLTLLTIVSRQRALDAVSNMLEGMGAEADLVRIALRKDPLVPLPPPGFDQIISTR